MSSIDIYILCLYILYFRVYFNSTTMAWSFVVSTECPAWSTKTFHSLSEPEHVLVLSFPRETFSSQFICISQQHFTLCMLITIFSRVKETFTHIPEDILLGSTFLSIMLTFMLQLTYPGSSNCKESACNARDLGSIPGYRRSPGEGHGNPFQYSCLENSRDREAWWAIVHGLAKSWTQLSN